jgi:hypothetical protein
MHPVQNVISGYKKNQKKCNANFRCHDFLIFTNCTKFNSLIYTISGIKAILQDSSVKIADDEGVSPSSSVITRVSCNML